jgi:hypothetical protein
MESAERIPSAIPPDLATARNQLQRMLEGYPAGIDDLDEDAFVLAAARLPKRQRCADAENTSTSFRSRNV